MEQSTLSVSELVSMIKQRIPCAVDTKIALQALLLITSFEDDEALCDALTGLVGKFNARYVLKSLSTTSSSFRISPHVFREMILAAMSKQKKLTTATDSTVVYDIDNVASETLSSIKDATRVWMSTQEGTSLWNDSTFRDGLLYSLHIGETADYCRILFGTLMASDARRLDEVKSNLDDNVFDTDVLIRLTDQLAVRCSSLVG